MPNCKDCSTGTRPAPYPGPRCATHHRAFRKDQRARQKAVRIKRVYGLQDGDYEALKAAQGGRCAICRIATGATRALATDHDHSCCPGKTSCGKCVRGLLCARCNHDLLGYYDVPALIRAVRYLLDPPGPKVLQKIRERK